jgi:hypothetical protein
LDEVPRRTKLTIVIIQRGFESPAAIKVICIFGLDDYLYIIVALATRDYAQLPCSNVSVCNNTQHLLHRKTSQKGKRVVLKFYGKPMHSYPIFIKLRENSK